MASLGADDMRARIEAWRDSGADRVDPVRFRLLEALARRMDAHRGEARRRLEDRLAGLVQAYEDRLQRAAGESGESRQRESNPQRSTRTPGPLAALARELRGDMDAQGEVTGAAAIAPRHPPQPDPALVDYVRRTWTRLSADRAWRQSLERVPENAGPLNSNHLIHRALSAMRELSPGYLQQLLSYVDTLSRLERMSADGAADSKGTPPAASPSKAARGKARQSRARPAGPSKA
ncbi:DUF2894 domain-containing protein [Cupriavidus gilardii]|uniref:DUF2894 domain-containing protein n=1 Tax=Cupriavidus gilardii TaxID=82541 RepID=UPI0021BF8E36|nr:DUF2894 domain-containing protein [Cupriavidus gilardii]